MAFAIIRDDIRSADGQDSSGKQTFTRSMSFSYDPEKDTVIDLMQSDLFPIPKSKHPIYNKWILDSVSAVNVVKGSDGRDEMWITAKYSRGNGLGSGNEEKVYPWDYGVQNFQDSYETSQNIPMTEIYNEDEKDFVPFVNTAGSPLVHMKNAVIRTISFDKSFEVKGGRRYEKNEDKMIINSGDETVCGIPIPQYCGMLMPMTANLYKVFKGKDLDYEYETVHFTIRINMSGWKLSFLNVGRLAKFPADNDNEDGEVRILSPIYQYTPWKSTDQESQVKTKPKFGSINDVIKAQNDFYVTAGGSANIGAKIPFSQVDEDMPLDENGGLYQDAIDDPVKNPYLKIEGFESEPESWSKFDLPKGLED